MDGQSWMLTHSDSDLSSVRRLRGKHRPAGFHGDAQKRPRCTASRNECFLCPPLYYDSGLYCSFLVVFYRLTSVFLGLVRHIQKIGQQMTFLIYLWITLSINLLVVWFINKAKNVKTVHAFLLSLLHLLGCCMMYTISSSLDIVLSSKYITKCTDRAGPACGEESLS